MMTTNKELVHRYFPGEYEIVEEPYLGYEIHIGKRSYGWKPLFQWHKNAYTSVSEMMQFIREHPEIQIFDEYGDSFSVDQLKEELVDWAECQEKRVIEYEGVGKIQAPIDHVEISERESEWSLIQVSYWHDKDGYDFTDREFC